MYHSIIFGVKNGDQDLVFNTWDDFHLIPASRPLINAPEPKTSFVEIPGSDSVLDYTELLSGLRFGPRQGSWEFYVENGYGKWNDRYTRLLTLLHGKKVRVVLEDDPSFYYDGRLSVTWRSEKDWSKVAINYVLGTYKYPTHAGSTKELDWLWEELFDNIIYYGSFDVVNNKKRTLINPTGDDIPLKITCSSMMTAKLENGSTVTLPAGESSGLITINSGDNKIEFIGNGRVVVDYTIGKTL